MADTLENHVLENIEGLEHFKERGRGCYGAVFEVNFNGVPCIAKKLHNILIGRDREVSVSEEEKKAIIAKFKQECLILSRLRHPNIVQFLGVCLGSREDDVTLIMESVHMDLEKCIRTYPNMPLEYKVCILRDVAYGLSYLHSVSVIHRDLNQGNVLLTEALTAKIADLGASKVVDRTDALTGLTTAPGAIGYMPPEAQKSPAVYDCKLDCFSFGHLALYILNSKMPHLVDSNITAIDTHRKQIQRAKRKSSLTALGTGHIFYDLVNQCLFDEPHRRPSSRELAKFLADAAKRYPVQYKNTLEYLEIIEQLQDENAILKVHGTSPKREFSQGEDGHSDRYTLQKILDVTSERQYTEGRYDASGKRIDREQRPRPVEKEFVQLKANKAVAQADKVLNDNEQGRTLNSYSSKEGQWRAEGLYLQLIEQRPETSIRPAPCDPNSPVMDDSPDYESLIYDDIFSESPGKMKVAESRPHNITPVIIDEYDSDVDDYEFAVDIKNSGATRDSQPNILTSSLNKISSSLTGLSPIQSPSHQPPPPVFSLPVTSGLPPNRSPSPAKLTATAKLHGCIYQKMSREVAEALCAMPGDYLVRASPTTNGLVLSNRLSEDECAHLSIHKTVKKSLRSMKTHYFFNEGELFDNVTDLIADLASTPFVAESNKLIILKKAITKEDMRILQADDFVVGGILRTKRQYTLSSSVLVSSREEVTVKILTEKQQEVLWEAYILSQLNHENIVRMAGACIQPPICLLLEECARNCLTDFLTSNRQSLDNSFLLEIIIHIAAGMSYLHSQNLIHRTLAARNCVLSNHYTTAKVANLQRCCAISKDSDVFTDFTNFAIGWASPEVLNTGQYSKASDVWSFGVLMWEVFHLGKEPYRGLNKAQIIEKIQMDSMIKLPPSVPSKCFEAFNGCFRQYAQKRWTFQSLYLLLQEDDTDYI